MSAPKGRPFGVYVHIPFCRHRCDYCAFATWDDRPQQMAPYLEALRQEIRSAQVPPATSVFFGGGTPSLVPGAELARVLAEIPRVEGAEVTVECNPEDVTVERLSAYRSAGVNRISMGVQSMAQHVLQALGRQHDLEHVYAAAQALETAGWGSGWNMDLIFGAVGESVADWEATLGSVLSLPNPPPHISAYGLTAEPGTPLGQDPARRPDADDEADKYLIAERMLSQAGLGWYEISNWARPGAECRHNLLYWEQGDYRGFGCSAHSHASQGEQSRRWWNLRTPERYIKAVAEGASVEAAGEDLDPTQVRTERFHLALRTRYGVPVSEVGDPAALGEMEDAGMVTLAAASGDLPADRVTLTVPGRLMANEVGIRLAP